MSSSSRTSTEKSRDKEISNNTKASHISNIQNNNNNNNNNNQNSQSIPCISLKSNLSYKIIPILNDKEYCIKLNDLYIVYPECRVFYLENKYDSKYGFKTAYKERSIYPFNNDNFYISFGPNNQGFQFIKIGMCTDKKRPVYILYNIMTGQNTGDISKQEILDNIERCNEQLKDHFDSELVSKIPTVLYFISNRKLSKEILDGCYDIETSLSGILYSYVDQEDKSFFLTYSDNRHLRSKNVNKK